MLLNILKGFLQKTGFAAITYKEIIMICISFVLLYLAIKKEYEPFLLVPIAFGMLLTNLPLGGLMQPPVKEIVLDPKRMVLVPETKQLGGLLYYLYRGVELGIYPPLIFLGVGAMTDFGPLIANPNLLGPIAVAAYSYMALVPIIQPPIIKALTTEEERKVVMEQLRTVSKKEKIIFPILVTLFVVLLLPSAAPLIGMLMLGNLLRESGVVDRLSKTAQNELTNIITIFLGLTVGATADAETFLSPATIKIMVLGLIAFSIGTAFGVLFGKIMYKISGGKVNPMIGAAGVSAVPMSARVVQKLGQEENPKNFLLMHAMGPNVAGVIGSAIAAGLLLMFFGN
jgi:Na+-transporting methylmalonyl-CoA/oxaloacetate decarboxylase beta subunit